MLQTKERTECRARLDSFEPWCIDTDTRDSVVARRNVLVGLWAGRLMGMNADALTAYARAIHRADYETSGIVAKLRTDLARAGHLLDDASVRRKLTESSKQAWLENSTTD